MKKLGVLIILLFGLMQSYAQNIMNIHLNDATIIQIPLNSIDSITYTSAAPVTPSIVTNSANNITAVAALTGGNITDDGGSLVTQRGVVWSTSPDPVTSDNFTNDGSGIGSYTSSLSGLNPSTTYYIRAYATNSAGTSYGNEISFTTLSDGNQWLDIGDSFGGGIIVYFDGNGGGLIAAPSDQSTGSEWGCFGTDISGAENDFIGTGFQNTNEILNGCTDSQSAAAICDNFTLGGFDDWFLPSKDELDSMYQNLHLQGFGDLTGNMDYWSSSQVDYSSALLHQFGTGSQYAAYKTNSLHVRAVRYFVIPPITTTPIQTLTDVSVLLGGNITDDGGSSITQRGVVWSTSPNPTTSDNITEDGIGIGSYTSNLSGLDPSTTYYLRAYATNSVGTSYGNEISFTTYDIGAGELAIGDNYQGGIVFYLDGIGGGLIASPSDQSTGAEWGCVGLLTAPFLGSNQTFLGLGYENTVNILAACSNPGIAAEICSNLSLGGYDDWFLPSKDELNLMYQNLHLQGLGGFVDATYWSSSEDGPNHAWTQWFLNGSQDSSGKSVGGVFVHAARAF